MDCLHFRKARFLKRILGIKGYCELYKEDLLVYNTTGYHPYIYCRVRNGKVYGDCQVQLNLNGRSNLTK